MTPYYFENGIKIFLGDCRETMQGIADNSIDAIVTDPPYALTSVSRNGSPRTNDPETPYGRTRLGSDRGFMGKTWDTGKIVHDPAFWMDMLRIAKPGAHLLAFGGSRTFHRLACAIEDAGWEIRDTVMWIYGSGFPKSLNLKDEWAGFGTALKPAHEPIMVARKPLDGTVAENVQRWGVGALDIDGCRVGTEERFNNPSRPTSVSRKTRVEQGYRPTEGNWPGSPGGLVCGRWPANLIHDGSEEVVGLFPEAPRQLADASLNAEARKAQAVYGAMRKGRAGEPSATSKNNGEVGFNMRPGARRVDCGSAARFFYTAKASGEDRGNEEWEALPLFSEAARSIRNPHPTVKPLALMRYLIKLVTREGHQILDPFMGSGSTLVAAKQISRKAIGCELEREYIETAERRLSRISGTE